jgi:hypothetical protein
MTNKTATTATQTKTQLNKAFTNAKLNTDLEREIYQNGRDSSEAKRKGVRLDNNNALMIDDLIAECKENNNDFSALERIGLKHKTFDLKSGYLGKDDKTPESCKAFKTAVGKAFDRAYKKDPSKDNLKTLQGCGMGGVPKMGTKNKPKAPKPVAVDKGDNKVIDLEIDDNFDSWGYKVQQHFIKNLLKRSKVAGKVVNS